MRRVALPRPDPYNVPMSAPETSGVILVPTYCESRNVPRLVARLESLRSGLDLVIIDDSSPDGTGQVAEDLRAGRPWLHVLHRPRKEGIGRAYADGFDWALERGYATVMMMDGDLSHDPAAVPELLAASRAHEAVFGSRYLNGVRVCNWSFGRLLLSKFSNDYIRWMLGVPSTDTTTAFKCYRSEVLRRLGYRRFRGRQNAFLIELVYRTYRLGVDAVEVPFMFIEREEGASKMRLSIALESLWTVLRLFPTRFFPVRR
ncbi:MAG: Undecaprenyl-phosphate mannosyltransferase [Candidatus Omnitrophica bacterium]|nr:Undecaprenyl-phosphate mannosyltransferase [Candidatus Omnitrophota bacterium]